ncbi:MAG TPA: hypothetical protein VG675_05790 [Bryobacteraceae bacterium]|nr:hypothetical protein [Bryobacteraceae bacterium]
MLLLGYRTGSAPGGSAFAAEIETPRIISRVDNVKAARTLPVGSVVGDLHGGLTFSEAVAAALEFRSSGGWQQVRTPEGEIWTVVLLDR